jgi:hypothetical protein
MHPRTCSLKLHGFVAVRDNAAKDNDKEKERPAKRTALPGSSRTTLAKMSPEIGV